MRSDSNPPPILDLFFKPERVAIVGLSRAALNSPVSVLTTLSDFGYRGQIYIINPNIERSTDKRAYPSLDDVPDQVDLAVITVERLRVMDVLRGCVRNGIRAAIVITQGFADADAEGEKLQEEMVALVRENDVRVLGPNTIGVSNALDNFTSSFIEIHNDKTPVGIVSQSGLFLMGHNLINNEPAGFCMAADLGNACDISLVDVLDYYAGLDHIRVIQCHLEGIRDGQAFVETASRVTQAKPIAMLKAGKTKAGQVAVASHSGAAAGKNEVYRAAIRKAGIVQAENAEELRLLSKAFVTYAPPKGRRVAIFSYSGGGAILAIDAIEEAGLELATFSQATKDSIVDLFPPWMSIENPLDCWIPVSRDLQAAFPRMLEAILADDGVDAVICIYCSYTLPKYDAFDCTPHITEISGKYPEKPVLCWSYGIDIAGFTEKIEREGTAMVFPSLEAAAGTIAKLVTYDEDRHRLSRQPSYPAADIDSTRISDILGKAGQAQDNYLFFEALEILESCHLDVANWRLANSEDDLIVQASSLAYPLCMKVVSTDIVHKSDSGGIRLGINDKRQLVEQYRSLIADVTGREPLAGIEAVLVQEMAPKGKELMIGAKRDPVFGHCLILGAGGIFTEIFDDFVFRLAPLTAEDANQMINELRFSKILKGVRGEAACHMPSIVDALLKLSQLVCAHPEIQELDINPLIANDESAVVVDARLFL